MRRMRPTDALSVFLLGFVVAHFAGGFTPGAARAENARTSSGETIALAGNAGQGKDTVFLFDAKAQKLAVYHMKDSALSLVCVRNVTFDFKFDTFVNSGESATQSPTVEEVAKHFANNPPGPGKQPAP